MRLNFLYWAHASGVGWMVPDTQGLLTTLGDQASHVSTSVVKLIGGTKSGAFGQVGVDGLDWIHLDGCRRSSCSYRPSFGLRLVHRIRPLQPSLDLEWAVDCEHLTTATVEGSKSPSTWFVPYLAHHPRPR